MKKRIVTLAMMLLAVGCSRRSTDAGAGKTFKTPDDAASALIRAADRKDMPALLAILGPDGKDLVASQDATQDENRAAEFAARAKEKRVIEIDPSDRSRATLVVGNKEWPLPIPIVHTNGSWRFDTKAGRDEVLARRIGANELNIITICRGFVEAEKQYASEIHDGSGVNQYAQRMVSTPGKHDGLAWQNPDGSWGGPVGPTVAKALQEGYAANKPFQRLSLQGARGPGTERAPRDARLHGRGRDDRRLRARGVACGVRRHRGPDLHGQLRRHRLPEGPGPRHLQGRPHHRSLRPRRHVETHRRRNVSFVHLVTAIDFRNSARL